MTPPASPEASEVRRRGQRRLIGAVAIVLLLVVFVPMLLDSEPRRASTGPELQIPPRENPPPLPAPVPPSPKMAAATPTPAKELPALRPSPKGEGATSDLAAKVVPEATKAAAEAQVAVVEPQAVAKKAAVLKQPEPPSAQPSSKAEGAVPPKAEGAMPRLEGFAIQVGAFRDEDKLRQAREKLAAAGVVHYTERVENPSGPITRLRAGPFPTRPAAEATMGKIKGVAPEAKVVALP